MRRKNSISMRITSLLLACCSVFTMLAAAVPARAAEPDNIPSQITLSIGDSRTDGTTSMAVNWVTDPDVGTSEIIYGQTEDLADGTAVPAVMTAVDSTDYDPASKAGNVKDIHAFRAMLNGLEPGETYYYKVGSTEAGYSSVASFTAPAASEDEAPFSFLISADTQGTSPSSYQNTADLYDYLAENESDAAFMIHTGDVVEDASYSDYWQYFFDAAEDLLRVMPIMATPGNHDSGKYDTTMEQFRARFDYTSLTAPEGLSEVGKGTVYSFEYGNALIICLNSYLSEEDDALQWEFLADQCASTGKAWKIVYYHEAIYDPGASHYQLDNEVGMHMTDAGVDLVLNGHEHAYARTTLRTTSTENGTGSIESAQPGEAPTYVIGGSVYNYAYSLSDSDTTWNDVFYDLRIEKTGTGGGKIYAPGVYGKVEVTSNSLVYTAYYKATGEENAFRVIDTFTIQKGGEAISQPTGTGEAPRSVTYLWDSFEQEKGVFSARFNWVTDTDVTGSQLFYAKKSDFDSNGGRFTDMVLGTSEVVDLSEELESMKYTGGTANYGGEEGADYCYAAVRGHKAETPALEPDTEYVYCVGDGYANTTSVTSPQVIKTPAQDTDTFSFLFFTDAQQGACGSYEETLNAYSDFSAMLDRATEEYPDAAFILSGGDQVNYGIDTWEWDAFFASSQDIFSQYPLYLSTGNHECDGAGNEWTASGGDWTPVDQSCSAVLGRYNPPENGAAYYGGGDGTERMISGVTRLEAMAGNYFFIYGDTLFLILDYQDSTLGELTTAQQAWIKSVVAQNPTKWRVAVMHKTLFGYRVSDPTSGVYRTWSDTFDEAGIDLVLMGHDHVYARTKYYANGAVTEPQEAGSGTTYITGASGNTDNRSDRYVEKPYTLVHSTTDYGRAYVAITISPEEIRVTTKGLENDVETTVEDNALVTNKPRTYDLSGWTYPEVPEETDDLSVTSVAVTGYAKEGQTLTAKPQPASATVAYQWERSGDGSAWTTIDGAAAATYTVKTEDVGAYLRCTVTGTGFYHGTAASEATGKVTALLGGGETVQLNTADEFEAFVNNFGSDQYPMDGNYELTASIDLDGKTLQPIGGSEATPFLGTFNGGGYSISNLTIESDASSVGLFAYVGANGRVVNVKLENVSVSAPNSKNTGAIAGACAGTIENCSVTGTISGNDYTAGLVGRLHGGTVQNCFVDAAATGKNGGGLIGGTNYGGPITAKNDKTGNVVLNNLVLGTVNGTSYTGAIVGDMGGSSGCPLQTFTGNAINASVTASTSNCIAGYWSGSRPILDADPVNYAADTLSKDGISSSNTSAQNAFVFKPAAAFAEKATYEALGWDFETAWMWDEEAQHPVPRTLEVTNGDGLVTIIATAGNGGTISPEGYVLVTSGGDQTFTFSPNDYYEIDSVKIDGEENTAAAEAGSYTFENVTALHTIEVSFRLSDATSGRAPSLASESAYYNRTQNDHINLTVDFGEGALGIAQENWRKAVESVRIMKDGQLVFDCSRCYWFPSHGAPDEPPAELFQICYDDMQKKPDYNNLVPDVYDLVITFQDLQSTVCTIPLTVVEKPVHQLTVTDATFDAQGAEDNVSSKVAEDTLVTVTASVPEGKVFGGWAIAGLEGVDTIQNPLTFQMPQNDVTISASFRTPSSGSSSNTYTVSVDGVQNGSVTVTPKNAGKGDTVTITVTPDKGYQMETLTVTDKSGNTVKFTEKNSKYTFTMPASAVTVKATFAEVEAENPFVDVAEDAYYYDAVLWAAEEGITSGTDATHFSPDATCTRAQAVTFLWCAAGSPAPKSSTMPFTDVTADAYYHNAVLWAVENGITSGTSATTFSPDATCTRAQIVTFLWRAQESSAADTVNPFTDVAADAYYNSAVLWAVENGITAGTTATTFSPDNDCTRAQIVTFLYRSNNG